MNKEIKGKYYIVYNLDVARAVHFITGENYYIFDNINIEGEKVYSFRNTPKVKLAVEKFVKLKKEFE